MNNCKLSIVSPIYKAEGIVAELVRQIEANVRTAVDDYEIILVNDASPDSSWGVISHICKHNKHVKGLNLSRNFGQHYAISAGLECATGDWIVVMDCDLQDRPDEILNLLAKAQEGYDIVFAQRLEREDTFLKKMSSSLFHSCYALISGQKTDKSIANFGIYSKQVIGEYNKMKDRYRAFGSLILYLGFKKAYLPVRHSPRASGSSSYSLKRLLRLSCDVLIINSNRPLYLLGFIGFIMSAVSMIFALYNVGLYVFNKIQVDGFTTIIVSIWFVGGVILMMLGVLGIYIGKTFDQVKNRQIYIVMDKLNIE